MWSKGYWHRQFIVSEEQISAGPWSIQKLKNFANEKSIHTAGDFNPDALRFGTPLGDIVSIAAGTRRAAPPALGFPGIRTGGDPGAWNQGLVS